ncbi:MBL fold metallo-hydrolase [Streptomyces sp. NPDC005438]|uniref:MBL fold metallo-hydrolase n=1 Tax=Streptomyces sp. NPDC005438 TaxID=3156880 RepID=UPI0033A949CF
MADHGTHRAGPTAVDQRTVEVAPDVLAVLNGDGSMGLSNTSVIVRGRSAVVVDTMLTPAMAEGIRHALRQRALTPALVLNTHHHVDHVGGNSAFPEAPVVAHPVTADIIDRMAADLSWLPGLFPDRAEELRGLELVRPAATPNPQLPPGARPLTFRQAHSPADLAVWIPDSRTLVAGDLCFNGVTPLARHGRISGWTGALEDLLALDPDVIVPGHGPLATQDTLRALHRYLTDLLKVAERAVDAGATLQDALAETDPGEVGEWREPDRTRINLQVAMAEVSGTPLPVGPPR